MTRRKASSGAATDEAQAAEAEEEASGATEFTSSLDAGLDAGRNSADQPCAPAAAMGDAAPPPLLLLSSSPTPPWRFRAPRDLRAFCRLIALHARRPAEGSTVRFSVESQRHEWRVLLALDIGRNVRCLVFAREEGCLKCECEDGELLWFPSTELVLALNWFSPGSFVDYVTLGLSLTHAVTLESVFGMCSSSSFAHAQAFLQDSRLRDLILNLKLGFIPPHINRPSSSDLASLGVHSALPHCRRITLCGFSMGGSTAHALAVLLKELHQVPQELRVVGLGCPRPGNERLTQWFRENLTADSMNVAMYIERESLAATPAPQDCVGCGAAATSLVCRSANQPQQQQQLLLPAPRQIVYDPAILGPSCARGFAVHPRLFLMRKGSGGYLHAISAQEQERLRFADSMGVSPNPPEEESGSLGSRLFGLQRINGRAHEDMHSVLKYFEEMVGL